MQHRNSFIRSNAGSILRPIAAVVVILATSVNGDDNLRFNRDIRPLLSENCFACHGPSAKKDEGLIRLDQRDTLLKPDSEGRTVLVPGDADASELIRRILSTEDGVRMPPAESKKSLTDDEKQKLVRWVREGAEYEPHWAFIPPQRPELPAVKNATWPRNEIDRFILARLEAEGMPPSPEAERTTLLRRLSLDLIGLPPTIAELDAFLADDSPGRLRQTSGAAVGIAPLRRALGAAVAGRRRYADSDGFEKDKPRFVSRYRDWVINAFNADLPYDQFVIDQIAGDLPAPVAEFVRIPGLAH